MACLDDQIEDAKWLTTDEKKLLRSKIDEDDTVRLHGSAWSALANPQVWLLCLVYFCLIMGLYGVSFWLPTIIKAMGVQSATNVGFIYAIPYLAAAIGMVVIGRSADRRRERRWHIAIPCLFGTTGLVLSVIFSHTPVLAIASLSLATLGYPLYYAYKGAPQPPRAGASHSTIYPYGPFHVGDGQTVMLGLQNEREWGQFCEHVLMEPELAEDERFSANARRSEHRDALRAIIVETFSTLNIDEVIARLEEAQIANAKVNDMKGVWGHPQLRARERWVQVGSPAGELPALLPPGTNSAFTPRMDAIPALGQHTHAILRSLGRTDAQIEALHATGAV